MSTASNKVPRNRSRNRIFTLLLPPKTELKSVLDDILEPTTRPGSGQEEDRETASRLAVVSAVPTAVVLTGGRALLLTGGGGAGGRVLGARAGACGRDRRARPAAAVLIIVAATGEAQSEAREPGSEEDE